MTLRMGRMTKRNRAKYRRRAYVASMLRVEQRAEPMARTQVDIGLIDAIEAAGNG